MTIEDGDTLLKFAKSIGRSTGYMDKRAYCVCLAIENCVLNEEYVDFCASNISIRYRGLIGIISLKKRKALIKALKGEHKSETRVEILKKQIEHLSMIFYSCVKEFSWGEFSLLSVDEDLLKSDIPFLMPKLSSHNGYYGRNLKDWINSRLT